MIYGLYNVSLVAIIGFGPLMLIERGWTIAAASSTTSAVLWLVALSLPFGGWLADRTGRNSTILVGGLIGYAGVLLLSSRVDAVLPSFILLGVISGLPCGPILSLPARVLVDMLKRIDSPSVGICLDTANSLSCLETPQQVVETLGPWTVNLHIKDFQYVRPTHHKGFLVEGRPAGQGQLDIPAILASLRQTGRAMNAIVELWPPPEATIAASIAMASMFPPPPEKRII